MGLPRVPKGPAAPSKSGSMTGAGLVTDGLLRAAGFRPMTDVISDPGVRKTVGDEYTRVLEEKITQQNWELEFLRDIAKASKDFVSADRMAKEDSTRLGRRGKARQRLYSAVDKYTQYMRNR